MVEHEIRKNVNSKTIVILLQHVATEYNSSVDLTVVCIT